MSAYKLKCAVPVTREDSKHCTFQASCLISQNHRIAGVGRDLWRSSTPVLTEGSAKVGCSGSRPVRFWMFPGMETPQPLWAIRSSLQPPSRWKMFSVPAFGFGSIAPCLFSRHYWEESDFVFLIPPSGITPACTGVVSPQAQDLCIYLCWISWGSSQPISQPVKVLLNGSITTWFQYMETFLACCCGFGILHYEALLWHGSCH